MMPGEWSDARQDFLSPAQRSKTSGLALRWEDLPRRAHRVMDIAHTPYQFNNSAAWREPRRPTASNRRHGPVMAGRRQRFTCRRLTPPLTCEQGEHRKNIMTESSPDLTTLQSVSPVRPAAGYIGGKRNLAKRICALIEGTPHTGYAEPFVGMGGIFLRRAKVPRVEVINDWSMDVANFFRICQRHYVAFMDMLRFQLTTRAGFEQLIRTDPTTLTDLERAARFLYLQRTAFGGKVAGRHFGRDRNGSARFDITKLAPVLEAIHERLSSVTIERLPWADFMRQWDRPGMLFYCDPPYFGCEGDYGAADTGEPLFDRSQFEQMAITIAGLKGTVIISLNDRPEVRKIFADFELREIETTYSIAGAHNAKRARELLIIKPGKS